LIGSALFWDVLQIGKIKSKSFEPFLSKIVFRVCAAVKHTSRYIQNVLARRILFAYVARVDNYNLIKIGEAMFEKVIILRLGC
jgi:hypothetical protein